MSRERIFCLSALLVGALPLLLGSPAPLEDWPSHLARADILGAILKHDPFWSRFYTVNSVLIPYFAQDFTLAALCNAGLGLDTAGQIVLAGTFVLFVGGAVMLARALGAYDDAKLPLFALLFYNGPLAGGFVNFAAGSGLAFGLVALWIDAARRPLLRVAAAVLGALLIFFFHLIAACLAIFAIGVLELAALWQIRRDGPQAWIGHLSAPAALCALAAVLLHSPVAGEVSQASGTAMTYSGGPSLAGVLAAKLALPAHGLLDGSDGAGLAVLAAGLGLVVLLLAVGLLRRRVGFHIGRDGAVLGTGLVALALLLPNGIGGAGLGLDYRVAPFAVTVLACALRFDWRSVWLQRTCAALLALTLLGRTAAQVRQGQRAAPGFRDFEAAARLIPADSALLTAMGTRREAIAWERFWNPPTEYIGTRAVADHVFVGTVFAIRSQHGLVVDPRWARWSRILDVSDPARTAETWTFLSEGCTAWRAAGHAGTVTLLIVYPSDYSRTLPLQGPAASAHPDFQMTDACLGP